MLLLLAPCVLDAFGIQVAASVTLRTLIPICNGWLCSLESQAPLSD